jgi:hypothetical protein
MDLTFQELNLNQLVDFCTWDRTVNNQVRQPILDHINCVNSLKVDQSHKVKPVFGDHFYLFSTMRDSSQLQTPLEDTAKKNCVQNSKRLISL